MHKDEINMSWGVKVRDLATSYGYLMLKWGVRHELPAMWNRK
jgi:hypothetical protein